MTRLVYFILCIESCLGHQNATHRKWGGGAALAFDGRHFNNEYNNQLKPGIHGGENILEGVAANQAMK